MAKSQPPKCSGCGKEITVARYSDGFPRACSDCLIGMTKAERIIAYELSAIREFMRGESILNEHRDQEDNQVARLAKAVERLTYFLVNQEREKTGPDPSDKMAKFRSFNTKNQSRPTETDGTIF